MKVRTQVATAIAALLCTGSAVAAPNLVINGSFESGLSGWTLLNTPASYQATVINYNLAAAYPNGAFGEAVPPQNAPTNSPDAVGDHAAYFVSDLSSQETLRQIVFLEAGQYQIGFSVYAPANGYANAGDAFFSGSIAGTTLASYNVSEGPVTTWQTFAGMVDIAADGMYTIDFVFSTSLVPSKDVVIDQVYVLNARDITVPEPGTLALLGGALAGLGLLRRRRTRD